MSAASSAPCSCLSLTHTERVLFHITDDKAPSPYTSDAYETPDRLEAKLRDGSSTAFVFKINKRTKPGEVRGARTDKMGRKQSTLRLYYDGERADDLETAESVSTDLQP